MTEHSSHDTIIDVTKVMLLDDQAGKRLSLRVVLDGYADLDEYRSLSKLRVALESGAGPWDLGIVDILLLPDAEHATNASSTDAFEALLLLDQYWPKLPKFAYTDVFADSRAVLAVAILVWYPDTRLLLTGDWGGVSDETDARIRHQLLDPSGPVTVGGVGRNWRTMVGHFNTLMALERAQVDAFGWFRTIGRLGHQPGAISKALGVQPQAYSYFYSAAAQWIRFIVAELPQIGGRPLGRVKLTGEAPDSAVVAWFAQEYSALFRSRHAEQCWRQHSDAGRRRAAAGYPLNLGGR